MEGLWLFVIAGVVGLIIKLAQAKKEADLLERNPEAWKVLKASQADEQERKRRAIGKGAVGAAKIARIFLKK